MILGNKGKSPELVAAERAKALEQLEAWVKEHVAKQAERLKREKKREQNEEGMQD
jgi:hypothetical protein